MERRPAFTRVLGKMRPFQCIKAKDESQGENYGRKIYPE